MLAMGLIGAMLEEGDIDSRREKTNGDIQLTQGLMSSQVYPEIKNKYNFKFIQ
jgi:hypothetical protein